MSLILWGTGTSRTIRPIWALYELGLAFEHHPILPRTGETQTPEYTALTARQKIPLLCDGDLTITESAAIVCYLSDTYGDDTNRLVPLDPRQRGKCLEWCFFAISELDATALYVIRRHRDLKHIYGDAPVANEGASVYFEKQMRSVDRVLEDGRDHILGPNFSAADLILSTCLTWAVRYGVPVSEAARAYNARVTARPAHARALESNKPPAPSV